MSHTLQLFGTPGDFALILDDVGRRTALVFAEEGDLDAPLIDRIDASQLLAIAQNSDERVEFLAVPDGDEVRIEKYRNRREGAPYVVDQLLNPHSVVVGPGRLVDERTLLAGRIGTASDDPVSLRLFALFRNAVRRHFAHVKCCWLGPESVRLLDSGGRLAFDLNSPPEYDLQR